MTLPHWDLSNIFPGLHSAELQAALAQLTRELDELEAFLDAHDVHQGRMPTHPAEVVNGYLERMNSIDKAHTSIHSYAYALVTTDSYNASASRLQSQADALDVRVQRLAVRFRGWLGGLQQAQPPVWAAPGEASRHAFYLREAMEQSRYQMSEAEESLAAELGLSGATAWRKLQGTVTSQVTVDFAANGTTETLPMAQLQNIARHHADPAVRQRAHQAELEAWASVRESLAAALNGVKGSTLTLNARRGRTDPLHEPLDQARIDRQTLEAMLAAMRDAFPQFHRYFKAKAGRLGKERLAWWDIFAPLGGASATRRYSWAEARAFIVEQFGTFSPGLAAFAQEAFARNWIDAEPRRGKRGGAYCIGIPSVEEPRILCNFDGSLNQVLTLAHELGHGFHVICMRGRTGLQSVSPMTVNETASIFCETLVTEAALRQAHSPAAELEILEAFLQNAAQVLVDISSRFLFEQEVFEKRAEADLSADDFCEIMTRAQKATYGESLDERTLHPYMWAWKPHYYYTSLQFYNFPYAFGLLFGLGLYAVYRQRGPAFVSDYEVMLADTGMATPAELAARFGLDIRDRRFWDNSLSVIESKIERYAAL